MHFTLFSSASTFIVARYYAVPWAEVVLIRETLHVNPDCHSRKGCTSCKKNLLDPWQTQCTATHIQKSPWGFAWVDPPCFSVGMRDGLGFRCSICMFNSQERMRLYFRCCLSVAASSYSGSFLLFDAFYLFGGCFCTSFLFLLISYSLNFFFWSIS